AVAARRHAVEQLQGDLDPAGPLGQDDGEFRVVLHQEIRRLPEKYRVPVLLCYLEGLTHEEAARQLGWPLGTVKGRLGRARDLLRRRVSRRGVVLPASAVAAAVARQAEAVPVLLIESTLRAALAVAAGRTLAAGAVAAKVAALVKGA